MTGALHPPRGGGRSDAAVAGARAARMPGSRTQDPSWDPSLGESPSMRKNKCFSLSRSAAAPRAAPDRPRPCHASTGRERGWETSPLANPFAPAGVHFPDGQVLSWLLQPREGIEAAAFLLVRAYVV